MGKPPSKKDLKTKTIHGIYAGVITEHNLPQEVYFYNSQKLMSGVHKGWKNSVKLTYNSPDWKLYEAISDNIFLFSGAKMYKMTEEILPLMTDDKGLLRNFDDFKTAAGPVYDKYNETWLETEYETALSGSRETEKFNDFVKNDVQYLRWLTAEDETVCPDCGGLDDTVKAIDDWDETPPLHYNCNCTLQPEYDSDSVTNKFSGVIINKTHANFLFKNNPYKTGMIFPPHMSYFKGVPKELAKNNFGLPIPIKHELQK